MIIHLLNQLDKIHSTEAPDITNNNLRISTNNQNNSCIETGNREITSYICINSSDKLSSLDDDAQPATHTEARHR